MWNPLAIGNLAAISFQNVCGLRHRIYAQKARSVFQDLMFRASSQEDLKKPNKIQLLGPSRGYRSKKVAFMLRCGCNNKDLAVGSKSGCMSQYIANLQQQQSRAMLWLQEQYVAAGVKIWLQDRVLKSSFTGICSISLFFQIQSLSKPLYLVLFQLGAYLSFVDPCQKHKHFQFN